MRHAHSFPLRHHTGSLQILAWVATFKPKQLARSAAVPDIVRQLCTLATEPDPVDFDASNICQVGTPRPPLRLRLNRTLACMHHPPHQPLHAAIAWVSQL